MAAFGIAIITRSETRLAMAAILWFVLHQKVRGAFRLQGCLSPLACVGVKYSAVLLVFLAAGHDACCAIRLAYVQVLIAYMPSLLNTHV